MLDIWSDFLSLLSLVAGVVGSILIFESFFHRRWERSILWLALILAAVNQLSSKFAYMDLHTRTAAALGSCLCNALIVMVFYRARWDRALFVSVAGYALFSVPNYWIDWGAMQLFDLTHFQLIWNIPLYSVVFVIKAMSCSAIGLVVWLLHKPLPDSDAAPRVWVPLVTIFPVLTLVAFYAVYTRVEQQWEGVFLVLDVVDIAVLLLFDRLERSAIDREALVAARERARLQDENLQALSQAYSAQRKLTHDFRACLTTLSGMLEQGNVEQAQRYLEELKIRQTERILLVNTHNAAIDAVLNQKGYAAQKRGLDLRFRVNDLSALRLEPVDATLVLGNLLDNAMEACAALPERDRWVEAEILYHAKGNPPSLSISVVNPSHPVRMENGRPATTKQDPMLHGFGLQNVEEILERYGAEYTCFYEKGRFVFSADWPDRPPESKAEKIPRSRHVLPRS